MSCYSLLTHLKTRGKIPIHAEPTQNCTSTEIKLSKTLWVSVPNP
jgi:hypothetical protein